MHNLKKFALIIMLLAMGIGATANAATTAEERAESARAAINYDTLNRPEIIPLPGAAGFPSYVDVDKFTNACKQLDPVTVIVEKNGKYISLTCQSEDDGSVGVTAADDETTIAIHQTKQMNGNVIAALNNSFNIVVPPSFPSSEKCVEKIKEAQGSDSGNFGDVKIKFNSHSLEATCLDTPAYPSP